MIKYLSGIYTDLISRSFKHVFKNVKRLAYGTKTVYTVQYLHN